MEIRPFGARLWKVIREKGPLCAGIDPSPALLRSWGLDDTPSGLERFALTTAEAVTGAVGVAKPQSAFFERHGSRGIAVLERTVAELRSAGTLVILDAKRGDIGSTTEAYAQAYLERNGPLAVDALTASPFLGFGSLQPMVDSALRHGAGVFVLARTSNPESAEVQLARSGARGSVAEGILSRVSALNAGIEPQGSIGVVLGATLNGIDYPLEQVNGPLLVPGVGAQGATFGDVRQLFWAARHNLVVPVSRGLLAAGPDPRQLRERALSLAEECHKELELELELELEP